MPAIPRDQTLDASISLLREGNTFITARCQKFNSDIFETRLLLKKTICIAGEEAANEFYREGRFTRRGAIPPTTLMLLQDKGSVATLDDDAHRERKKMFMALMTPEAIQALVDSFERHWRNAISKWEVMHEVRLFDEVEEIICRAACEWSGIALTEIDAQQRTGEISAMIDGAGTLGIRTLRGILLRARTERWLRKLVGQVRSGEIAPPVGSALAVISLHKDATGNFLETNIAAVELLNILRPTVAVARYILFAAVAINEYPMCANKLKSGDNEYLFWFVQEVRRFYPFFPFIGGLVREPFIWRGYHFQTGVRVMLDVYGTCHDSRLWKNPQIFDPYRFRDWKPNAFTLIPQGGGDFYSNHRCAGEWIAIELIKRGVRLLVHEMKYETRQRNYTIDLKRMPALPKESFIIYNLRKTGTSGEDAQEQTFLAV